MIAYSLQSDTKLWEQKLPAHNMPEHQWHINTMIAYSLQNDTKAIQELQKQVGLHNQSIIELERVLPSFIAVEHVRGEWQMAEKPTLQ